MSEFQRWTSQHRTIRASRDWNALLDHGLVKPASYIIRKNGSYYEAINGSTGKIDYGGQNNAGGVSGTDAATVIQNAINAAANADQGLIFIKRSSTSYKLSSGLDLAVAGGPVSLVSDFAKLEADAGFSDDSLITVGETSLATELLVQGLILDCNGLADYGLKILRSSVTGHPNVYRNLYIGGFNAAGMLLDALDSSENTHFINTYDILINGEQKAGTSGIVVQRSSTRIVADSVFERIFITGIRDIGIHLADCNKITLRTITIANNANPMTAAIKIETTANAKNDMINMIVSGVNIENQVESPGYGVWLYTGTAKSILGALIENVHFLPYNAPYEVRLEQAQSYPRINGVTIRGLSPEMNNSSRIYIGADVFSTRIFADGIIRNKLVSNVDDHGKYTVINGIGKEAAGVGGTPSASNWSIGDLVFNTDDNTVWIKDSAGTMRQLA